MTSSPEGLADGQPDGCSRIRFVPLRFDPQDADASALKLVHALRPDWASAADSDVQFVRFTDGITNTLLKAVNKKAGWSKEEVDKEAILLRAYGNGTDVIIDRQRETQNHELLMGYGLAPKLLARFENGMMYKFIRGTVTRPEDMRRPDISRAIATRLAEWHVKVPCLPSRTHANVNGSGSGSSTNGHVSSSHANGDEEDLQAVIDNAAPGKPAPNVWTVMQKWILALPYETESQRQSRDKLQGELVRLVDELSDRPGLGKGGLVFAHTDLLSGNVIVLPEGGGDMKAAAAAAPRVSFIDYEYAVPSPAAFDIANHFAEWGGFDCDMAVLPTRSQRRDFITQYVRTYCSLLDLEAQKAFDVPAEIERLVAEVDLFRGVPGFYWGVWALIQARISKIDFDYASYAETRLSEYWAWRAEASGSRAASGAEMPLREKRWAQES